jgi:hypothetical protein
MLDRFAWYQLTASAVAHRLLVQNPFMGIEVALLCNRDQIVGDLHHMPIEAAGQVVRCQECRSIPVTGYGVLR